MARINLNLANEEELTGEGIEAEQARSLVEARRARGGFRDWNDVHSVPGLNEFSYERLKRIGTLGVEGDPDTQLEVPGDVSGEAAVERLASAKPGRGPA